MVVHDHYPDWRVLPHARTLPAAPAAGARAAGTVAGRGSRSSTSVPSPGTELMVAQPPRLRSRPQMDWLTPSRLAAAASASRPSGMPGPSSLIVTVTRPGSSSTSTQA